jgi:hypothetical protein
MKIKTWSMIIFVWNFILQIYVLRLNTNTRPYEKYTCLSHVGFYMCIFRKGVVLYFWTIIFKMLFSLKKTFSVIRIFLYLCGSQSATRQTCKVISKIVYWFFILFTTNRSQRVRRFEAGIIAEFLELEQRA